MIHFAGSWRRCAPPALKRAGVTLAALLTCSILTAPVFAQAPTQTAETQVDIQTIEVTGSRIRNADAASANPVTVLSSADIQATGAAQVEDLFQHTIGVDFNGGLSTTNNNGGAGTSNVGMRNLGVQRTLILIDGQRMIPANGGAVDLNSIPLAMIDRVEILRDGASSIYGADAIGGVINLITKKKSDGLTFDSYFGESGHGDGTSYAVSATAAFQTEKGNLMIGVSRDHTDAIPQANRDWATDTHASDPNFPGSSSYRNQISDALQDENSNAIYLNGNVYGRNTDCATIVAQTYGNACINGSTKLNASDWQTLTSELEHNDIFARGHYNITDNIQFNASGFYTQRKSEQFLRPEPILGDTIATNVFPGFIIPTDVTQPGNGNTTGAPLTAYLTPSAIGPRDYRQTSDTYRLQSSFSGTFFNKYDWEVGYVWQENDTLTEVKNEGNFYNLAQLVGETTCVNVPTGCTNGAPTTPVNWFNAPFQTNPWLANYLTFDNITNSQEVERYAYATINGDIYELPAGTAKFAVGGELRHEGYWNTPNELVIEGWGPNQQNPTAGGYDVGSGYAEVNIPVLADMPGVKSFNVDLSYRYDNYSTFSGASTWKGGFDYAVTEDLRLRGSFAKGFRAPQIGELFGGTVISDNAASGDPCETNPAFSANGNFGKGVLTPGSTCAAAAAKAGQNVATFVDPIDNTPNNQEQVLTGSNSSLKPETSHQFNLGTVITPRWVPGLTMAVDYYNVRITNTVLDGGIAGFLGADAVLDGCYGPSQNQAYCALITRNALGQITLINGLNTNFGTEKTQGIDFDITYERPARMLYIPLDGNFKFNVLATLQFQLKQTLPDGSTGNNVGTYTPGSNAFDPRWKGIINVEYAEGSWGVHVNERYMEHMQNFYDSNEVYGNYSPDMWYTDMSAYYNFTDVPYVKNVKFTVGMDNVFDKDPPWMNGSSADSVCKCGTIAGGYDEIGRYMFFRLSSAL